MTADVVTYGNHMSQVQKTTVYLNESDYRRLKALARARGRKPADLVREAVAQYAAREVPSRKARSVGAGKSGRGDLSERAEALLAGLGRRR
jgi:predicted transcriptional regulator